ncbi:MAG: flippase-like domain-containing protein [Planctomycetes bacterium]|nr:flippase-like domain-containing protein [Planctomycetota bacterium]
MSVGLTGLVLFAIVMFLRRHLQEVRDLLSIGPSLLLFAMATMVFRVFTIGWMNRAMLRALNTDLGAAEAFWLAAVTVAGNLLLPLQAGMAFRAKYLHSRHAVAYSHFLAILLGAQLLLFAATCFVATVSLLLLFPLGHGLRSDTAIFASVACLAASIAVMALPRSRTSALAGLKMLKPASEAWHALREKRGLLPKVFASCVLLRCCEATCFWAVCTGADLQSGWVATFALTSVAAIVSVTIALPGLWAFSRRRSIPSKPLRDPGRAEADVGIVRQLPRRVYFHGLNLVNYVAPLHCDLARFPEDTFIVAGSPRSGTTWVADVVARTTKSRIIFEPLLVSKRGNFVLTQNFFFRERSSPNYPLCIPASAVRQDRRCRQVETILRGRIHTYWSQMGTRPGVFRHRIIKEVRANLYLGFLAENWPAVKILFILRDPYSTLDSQIERAARGWDFNWDKTDVLSQAQLMEDWLLPFRATIERAETLLERLANKWCIETYVALCQLQDRPNAFAVSYEWLSAALSHWTPIERFLMPHRWCRKALKKAIDTPSFTSYRSVQQVRGHVSGYRTLDREAERVIARIIDEYGLSELSKQLTAGNLRSPSIPRWNSIPSR